MLLLHLDPNFKPRVPQPDLGGYYDITNVTKLFKFPAGEMHVKLPATKHDGYRDESLIGLRAGHDTILLTTRLVSSDAIVQLMLAVDAIRRLDVRPLSPYNYSLYTPYLPYAQQDRVMVPGEPLSAKWMGDLLTNLNFRSVTVFDPHSDVGPASLGYGCCIQPNYDFIKWVLRRYAEPPILVFPDAGAYKKSGPLLAHLYKSRSGEDHPLETAYCTKHRDPATGAVTIDQLSGPSVLGQCCLILDDICVGGATFVGVAEKLADAGAASVDLAVSHGVFSKGYTLAGIRNIYCTDSYQTINLGIVLCLNQYNLELP